MEGMALVLAQSAKRVNLPALVPTPTFRSVRFDYDPSDPPSPLAVVRGFLGAALVVATVALVIAFFSSGHVDTRLATWVGVLWLVWGVLHDVLAVIVQPFLGFLTGQLAGGEDAGPPLQIDLERETEMLERIVADPPSVPHREILAGIRLAEIYRTHQGDRAKSDALIGRLRAKYPDAPELRHDFVDS